METGGATEADVPFLSEFERKVSTETVSEELHKLHPLK